MTFTNVAPIDGGTSGMGQKRRPAKSALTSAVLSLPDEDLRETTDRRLVTHHSVSARGYKVYTLDASFRFGMKPALSSALPSAACFDYRSTS